MTKLNNAVKCIRRGALLAARFVAKVVQDDQRDQMWVLLQP
ncbi:hypothetical protein SAMN04489726_4643 [Allokutzneria albata]|uniref:Uncharacterized protein n=1 Tax=Allokutzneria albata TaxID=211114 RepID=A0A1G9Y7E6_ALLAB|nr:hypothetical protein SAMN04489726_4643 [Allokutzneria albata]